jgi:hypothetical protein
MTFTASCSAVNKAQTHTVITFLRSYISSYHTIVW